jgi:plastocyanin
MRCRLLALAALGLLGCGDDEPSEVDGLPVVEGAPEIIVVGSDYAFDPDVLHLVAGEPVNVVFESSENLHNLAVPDAGFALPIIGEGEVTRGALTIDEPGTYDFLCTVIQHAEEGMVGTVEVAEPD